MMREILIFLGFVVLTFLCSLSPTVSEFILRFHDKYIIDRGYTYGEPLPYLETNTVVILILGYPLFLVLRWIIKSFLKA